MTEQEFVAKVRHSERAPRGWPGALVIFHIGMWRERMRAVLLDISAGRDPAPPPPNADELNDSELPSGIGTPLGDAAARSERLLEEIIELHETVGDRPYRWYRARTTTEAVLGTSYTHPRAHMYTYLRENGEVELAIRLHEEAVDQLRSISASEIPMGAALYNLACARAAEGQAEEALNMLEETLRLRPDLKQSASAHADFAALRGDPRFQELTKPEPRS